METKNSSPTTDKKVTVITGSNKTPRKKMTRRMILILIILVVILGGIGYFIYSKVTAPSPTNKNTETVIDVSSQMDDANEYPKGSYMWANIMLNAATYAASNGACKQANDIIAQVENTPLEEPVDVSAVRTEVGKNCG
ncbi:hypothetical protein PV379_03000 [Streptomyces caniscabiei]|uniref:hypothetical protein n=1 Tax=Streptomyces caniscabiei TaxID=2746961 RepID=UPI0029A13764|nr:hypothetical protein [Streptomyces caniscabiei]MDX2776311.1 hypothetical protein [Streptomyces caniscabiei]